MDWPTIHAYAKEANLWTSLAINGWVILSALIAFAAKAIRRTTIDVVLIAQAGQLAGAFLLTAFAVGICVHGIYEFTQMPLSASSIVYLLGVGGSGFALSCMLVPDFLEMFRDTVFGPRSSRK